MEKKVPKLQIMQTNIPESVENIENPTVPMALRVSGHLLLGVVRIFSRKVTYLLTDCSEALVKIKDAFRAPGGVELAPGAGTRNYDDITRPNDQLDDEMDLDADLSSQAMLFAVEDDEPLGDMMPEDQGLDLAPAQHILGGEEDEVGFGPHDNFELFFDQVQPQSGVVPEEEDGEEDGDEEDEANKITDGDQALRSAKRRRTGDGMAATEPHMEGDDDGFGEEEDTEQFRHRSSIGPPSRCAASRWTLAFNSRARPQLSTLGSLVWQAIAPGR